MALPSGDVFFLDNFAVRQWDDPFYAGTRLTIGKEEFVKKIHEYHQDGACLVDGYAPFCKCASAAQRHPRHGPRASTMPMISVPEM